MNITYGVWIGLLVIGIIAGIYLIFKDLRDGTKPKIKRELQSSTFFTFVMFCVSVVSFFDIGISGLFFISTIFFLMGLVMVIHSLKKLRERNNRERH